MGVVFLGRKGLLCWLIVVLVALFSVLVCWQTVVSEKSEGQSEYVDVNPNDYSVFDARQTMVLSNTVNTYLKSFIIGSDCSSARPSASVAGISQDASSMVCEVVKEGDRNIKKVQTDIDNHDNHVTTNIEKDTKVLNTWLTKVSAKVIPTLKLSLSLSYADSHDEHIGDMIRQAETIRNDISVMNEKSSSSIINNNYGVICKGTAGTCVCDPRDGCGLG